MQRIGLPHCGQFMANTNADKHNVNRAIDFLIIGGRLDSLVSTVR